MYLDLRPQPSFYHSSTIILASAVCAACLSFGAILLNTSTAFRGLFHLISAIMWLMLNKTTTYQDISYGWSLPLLYTSALIGDSFILPRWTNGNRESSLGFLSDAIFGWLTPLVYPNLKTGFEAADLPDVTDHFDFDGDIDQYANSKDYDLTNFNSLWMYFFCLSKNSLATTTATRLVEDIATIVSPWLLRYFLEKPSVDAIFAMFLSRFIGAICGSLSAVQIRMLAVRCKAILTIKLHSTALRSRASRSISTSECVNLTEFDAQRLLEATMSSHDLWSLPLKLVLSIASLTYLLGWRIMLCTLPSLVTTLPSSVLIWSNELLGLVQSNHVIFNSPYGSLD